MEIGPFTVFAPTDVAFGEIPEADLNVLLDDPTGDLAKILQYHVLSGEVLSSDLSDGQTATTLFGQDIDVTINGDGVFINGDAMVVIADIETFNGVVHVLDEVLLPQLTAVSDLNQVQMSVSPNPASEYLMIELPGEMENKEVMAQLIGMSGATMNSWIVNDSRMTVDVSEYPAGTYIMLLNTDTDYARAKIVVD